MDQKKQERLYRWWQFLKTLVGAATAFWALDCAMGAPLRTGRPTHYVVTYAILEDPQNETACAVQVEDSRSYIPRFAHPAPRGYRSRIEVRTLPPCTESQKQTIQDLAQRSRPPDSVVQPVTLLGQSFAICMTTASLGTLIGALQEWQRPQHQQQHYPADSIAGALGAGFGLGDTRRYLIERGMTMGPYSWWSRTLGGLTGAAIGLVCAYVGDSFGHIGMAYVRYIFEPSYGQSDSFRRF